MSEGERAQHTIIVCQKLLWYAPIFVFFNICFSPAIKCWWPCIFSEFFSEHWLLHIFGRCSYDFILTKHPVYIGLKQFITFVKVYILWNHLLKLSFYHIIYYKCQYLYINKLVHWCIYFYKKGKNYKWLSYKASFKQWIFHFQGFHRYSTDQFWHVPHFEKMLYDQGQLLFTYSEAYQVIHPLNITFCWRLNRFIGICSITWNSVLHIDVYKKLYGIKK